MKYKLGLIFICLIICLFSIASVCAADVNETLAINDDSSEDVMTIENEDLDNVSVTEENELSATTGTFTDLANDIQNANGELNLTKNYVFSNTKDSNYKKGISIINKIKINGNGFTINGMDQAQAFKISCSNVIITNCNFVKCSATHTTYSSVVGGAIDWKGDNGILSDCTFTECSCISTAGFSSYKCDGGAVNWGGANGFVSNCQFFNCFLSATKAIPWGGAIYWGGINGILTNSFFEGNSAYHGSAIVWAGKNGTLSDSVFIRNFNGSAIDWLSDNGKILNSSFIENSYLLDGYATAGGAIYFSGKNCLVENSNFTNNIADNGAAIYSQSNNISLINCNICNNVMDKCNSIIDLREGNFINCTISDNEFIDCDIIHVNGNSYFLNCIFHNNIFNPYGPREPSIINFYRFDKSCIVSNCTFENNSFRFGSVIACGNLDFVNLTFKNSKFANNNYMFRGKDIRLWADINITFYNSTFDNHPFSNSEVYVNPKISTKFISEINNCNVGENITIIIKLSSLHSGSIYLKFNNTSYSSTIVNYTAIFVLCNLSAGSYSASITSPSNEIFDTTVETVKFEVKKWDSDKNISIPDNILSGTDCNINVILNKDATGSIILKENSNNYFGKLINGSSTIIVNNITGGIHKYEVLYSGDSKYNSFSISQQVNVTFRDSYIKLNVSKVNYFEDIITLIPDITPEATGNISIFIDNEFKSIIYPFKVYNISNLDVGDHIIHVIYNGNDFYKNCSNSSIITVKKIVPNISIDKITSRVDGVFIYFVLNQKANGNISIEINNKIYNGLVINGSSIIQVDEMKHGIYYCNVTYQGNQNYYSRNLTINISVPLKESIICVTPNYYYFFNDNMIIDYNITEGAKGIISIYINDTFVSNVSVGNDIELKNMTSGIYFVRLVYNGNFDFISSENDTILTVLKLTPSFSLDWSNMIAGDDIILNISFNQNVSGNVTFNIFDKSNVYNISNNQVQVVIPNVVAGIHKYNIVYSGNDNYVNKTCSGFLNVSYKKSNIKINIKNIFWNELGIFDFNVTPNAKGNISIFINDNYIQNISIGEKFNITNLKPDIYKFKAVYNGDEYYEVSENETILEVYKLNSTINLLITNINFGQDAMLNLQTYGGTNSTIDIFIDGKYNETISRKNHVLSNLNAGNHTIRVIYNEDDYYYSSENVTTLTVNKINTTISVSSIKLMAGNTVLSITLNNKATGNITVNVNNKKYNETLSSGKSTVYIYDLPAGNYEYTIHYKGDQNFNQASYKNDLNILSKESSIIISSNNIYVDEIAKINYTITSGATGILSVYVNDGFVKNVSVGNNIELENLPYGNYTVKVFYNGDDYYTPCENTTTFEVHKLNPTLRLSANNITSTNYEYFNTHITAGNDVNLVFIFNEDATGELNIAHEFGWGHESNYTLELVNGKSNISIPNVMADSHYFTISYSGDDKYLPFNGESEVYFNYKPSSINYTIPVNLIWGDSFLINPVLPDGATGEIEITVYDNNGYCFDDFMAVGSSYNFRILNGGTNYLRLDYSGDEYYSDCTYLREFNVAKLNTTCAITGNIEAGDYSTIIVTLNEDAKGTVEVLLNNKYYSGNLVNGSYMFTVPSLTAGIYDVTVKYNGDSKYNSFNKIETLNVTLKKTEILLNLKNIIVGRNLTFIPIVSSGATGHISIYVDGSYKQTIPVGSSYTVAKPGIGNHIVKVSYSSDGYFQSCENESSFWVFSEYPIVSQDACVIYNTGNYFKAQFLNEYASPLANGYVVFNVGGRDYARVTDNNGWATLDLDLDIGIYNVTSINLVYNENKVNKLTVFSSVETQDLTRAYNSGIDFNATFLNNNAKALTNTYVLFKVNNEDFTVKTNMNGQAILNVPLTVGTYIIVSINTLTGENKTNTLTIVPSVQASDMVRAYNSTMDYKATFVDVDGTYLANHAVNFKIGETTYKSTTDNKGVAILNVPLNVGEYNITAINPITGERSTKKLTILPRIIENNDMITDADCDDYFKVRVVGDNGNIVGSGQTVTFKFNNTIHNIKTDSQGYASLLISQLTKGKYPITATYKGFVASNNIFVYENLESIITIDVNDADYNQNLILNVSVIPEYRYGNLTVEIIGSNGYHVQYEASANAVFSKDLTGLNASDYVVAVRFTDNENYYMSQDTAVFEISKINPNIIVVVYDSEYSQNATITVNIPQASGNVTIRVGDKRTYTEYLPEDGVIVKKINDLDIGRYDISVTYNGNDNFNKVTKTAKLNITKIQTYVWLDSLDEFDYGQTIVVNLTASVDGVVKVEFDDDVQFVNVVADRLYQLKYYGYEAGCFYPVTATLTPANSNYNVSSYEISVGVASISTDIEVISDYIELGQPTNIVVIVNSSATGNVRLIWNNQEYVQNLTEGKTVFNIYGLGIGRYSLEVFYDGDNNFDAIDGLANFNVTKIKSYSIDIPSIVKNLDNNLTIGLPVNATGNVTVTINNVDYNALVANGQAIVNLSTLANADYPYEFVYSGDDRYSSFETTGTLTIKKPIVPEVVIPPLDNPSADGSVTVTLPSDATGTVTLTINGNDYPFVVKNGVANVVIPDLDGGNYPYTITYSGDGKYASFVDMGSVTIAQKMPTVLANNMTVTYGSGYDFIATFFKADGSPLANSYVMFAVNGNDNVVKTDANGIAILNIGLGNGVYDIVSTNLATGESANNVLTIVGQPTPTVISASSVTTVYNGGKYLVVTLKDSNGKALSGAKVTVVLDGKTYTLSTDANGQIKVFTNDLAPNAYVATITFGGDGKYVGSSTTAKITVVKATLKLTAAKKTYKAKIKTKKYTVTLKDNNGKVIRGMVITLKVKGKTFKAKTNAKGKATFKIKKLTKKGTFKATVKYAGNAYYTAVTKTVKIKIK